MAITNAIQNVTEPKIQGQTRISQEYLATPSSLFTLAHPRRVFSQLNRHQRGTIQLRRLIPRFNKKGLFYTQKKQEAKKKDNSEIVKAIISHTSMQATLLPVTTNAPSTRKTLYYVRLMTYVEREKTNASPSTM